MRLLAALNSAAINVGTQVSLWYADVISCGCKPGNLWILSFSSWCHNEILRQRELKGDTAYSFWLSVQYCPSHRESKQWNLLGAAGHTALTGRKRRVMNARCCSASSPSRKAAKEEQPSQWVMTLPVGSNPPSG